MARRDPADEAAIAAFLRTHQITKCPTACALPTSGAISEEERARLRDHHAARDAAAAARTMRRQAIPRMLAQTPGR